MTRQQQRTLTLVNRELEGLERRILERQNLLGRAHEARRGLIVWAGFTTVAILITALLAARAF